MLFLGTLILITVLFVVVPQVRRFHWRNLVQRVRRLIRTRFPQAGSNAADEQERISHDIQELVSHRLAAVVTLTEGAVAAIGKNPELAIDAMNQAAESGREALAEMRRLSWRTTTGNVEKTLSQPDSTRIDELLIDIARLGFQTSLSTAGSPAKLPQTAETTIYRIVQECLTNTIKHSRNPTRVDVLLRWLGDTVELEVRDDGVPRSNDAPRSGHGIRHMVQQAAALGGDLRFGPTEPRGWSVRARLRFDSAGT